MLKTWLNFFGVLIMKSHWLEKWEIEQDEKTEDIEERKRSKTFKLSFRTQRQIR